MNFDHLELLIGKLIDSEISPAEKAILDAAMAEHPELRERVRELEQLTDNAQHTLDKEVVSPGVGFEAVFARAQAGIGPQRRHRRIRLHPVLHVGATLAAGFLLGLITYGLVDSWNAPPQPPIAQPHQVVDNSALDGAGDNVAAAPEADFQPDNEVFYYYTDPQGRRWRMHPPMLRPDRNVENAGYTGDL